MARGLRRLGGGQHRGEGAARPAADPDPPAGWDESLPVFEADPKGVATRKASGGVLAAIALALPELWGGSADLADPTPPPKGEPSFIPEERSTTDFQGDRYGRVLHFGIREHAMGSIMNGIALHGGTRVYGGTFLVFSDYMRPAVRLASLMQLPVTYVWTHDSIGLGEDGPTHQPVEHRRAACDPRAGRRTPRGRQRDGRRVEDDPRARRPAGRPRADPAERPDVPARRGRPPPPRCRPRRLRADRRRGRDPDVVLVGTGSEVQLAVEARRLLAEKGVRARVVSMPCREWFDAQDPAYRDSVIPPLVRARVSVEAGVAQGWREWSATTAASCRSTTTAPRPTSPRSSSSSGSPRRPSPWPPRRVSPRPTGKPRSSPRTPTQQPPPRKPMSERLKALADAGVSIWLDDLSRERIETGNLAELVTSRSVVGVTTNPTIFAAALSEGERYTDQVTALAAQGTSVDDAVFELRRTTCVRRATSCSTRGRPPTGSTDGSPSRSRPGWRSTPTPPSSPRSGCGPRSTARTCSSRSPRPPRASPRSPGARRRISVNVTLIFGLGRYQDVMEAYVAGLEQAQAAGVSRTTSTRSRRSSSPAWTPRSTSGSTRPAVRPSLALAGVANARLAYRAYEEFFAGSRFQALKAAGGNTQRPWASTGVKNPEYRDTMYVADLVVANTVNTMPEKTSRPSPTTARWTAATRSPPGTTTRSRSWTGSPRPASTTTT